MIVKYHNITLITGVYPYDKGDSHTKAHNKYQGRKPLVIAKLSEVQNLIAEGMIATQATKQVKISRRTYYNAIAEDRLAFELKRQHVDEI